MTVILQEFLPCQVTTGQMIDLEKYNLFDLACLGCLFPRGLGVDVNHAGVLSPTGRDILKPDQTYIVWTQTKHPELSILEKECVRDLTDLPFFMSEDERQDSPKTRASNQRARGRESFLTTGLRELDLTLLSAHGSSVLFAFQHSGCYAGNV